MPPPVPGGGGSSPNGNWHRFLATGYGPPWEGIQGTGITATGVDLRDAPHLHIVAVDPDVIPLHTKMLIDPNPYGKGTVFQAEDTGGAINGKHIDIYFWRGQAAATRWGSRYVMISFLGRGSPPVTAGGGGGALRPMPAHIRLEGPPIRRDQFHGDYSRIVLASSRNWKAANRYLHEAGRAIASIRQ